MPEAKIIQIPLSVSPFAAGPQFGSVYKDNIITNPTREDLASCRNLTIAAEIIMFDLWIKNWDRNWLFGKNILIEGCKRYNKLLLIDHAVSFTSTYWTNVSLMFDLFRKAIGKIQRLTKHEIENR
jgi:hypothetical protein